MFILLETSSEPDDDQILCSGFTLSNKVYMFKMLTLKAVHMIPVMMNTFKKIISVS